MKHQKRTLKFLVLSILSLLAFLAIILFFSPTSQVYLPPFTLTFSPLYVFFPLLFLCFFSLGTYLFKSKKHGILIASFVVTYLLFRLNNLTHPFFFILLAGLFLTLELMVSYKK